MLLVSTAVKTHVYRDFIKGYKPNEYVLCRHFDDLCCFHDVMNMFIVSGHRSSVESSDYIVPSNFLLKL